MCRSKLKDIYFLSLFFLVGCTTYKVPIQAENHPASSDSKIVQIKLSPILDLKRDKPICNSEEEVHEGE